MIDPGSRRCDKCGSALRVFVTGGSGFLGTEVCRQLAALGVHHTVCDRLRPRLGTEFTTYVPVDIRDAGRLAVAMRGHCTAVHLAAEWNDVGVSDEEYRTTNVGGTRNVVTAADQHAVHTVVFASSSSVYDFSVGSPHPKREEDASESPPTVYGQTKVEGERLVLGWAERADRTLRIVRPSVIYGPHNEGNLFRLMRRALSSPFLFPDKRDVVKSVSFVENVAGFILYLVFGPSSQVTMNYCDEPPLTTYELIQLIRREGHVTGPAVGIPAATMLSISRLLDHGPARMRDALGSARMEKLLRPTQLANDRALASQFDQLVATEEGIRRTVEWVKSRQGQEGQLGASHAVRTA